MQTWQWAMRGEKSQIHPKEKIIELVESGEKNPMQNSVVVSSLRKKSVVNNVLYTNNPMQNSVVVSLLLYYEDVLLINDVPCGDWVWVHLRKKIFLDYKRCKL